LKNGRWPEPFGLHKCNNPPCCRPSHIYAGTQLDNMQQASRDGRMVKPVSSFCARGHKLTPLTTYWSNGKRNCAVCTAIRGRAKRATTKKQRTTK
jgi:hypothetical protein